MEWHANNAPGCPKLDCFPLAIPAGEGFCVWAVLVLTGCLGGTEGCEQEGLVVGSECPEMSGGSMSGGSMQCHEVLHPSFVDMRLLSRQIPGSAPFLRENKIQACKLL